MAHLPAEIIVLIGKAADPATRLALLQVCRGWRSMFFQLAYSKVHVKGGRLSHLVRSIHSNPEIASVIETLSLSEMDMTVMPAANDPAWVQGRVRQYSQSTDEFEQWLKSISVGSSDHWCALLLYLLENPIELHLEYPTLASFTRQILSLASRRRAVDTKPALKRLQKVAVDLPRRRFLIPSRDVFPFFYLPSIRSVSATGLIDDDYSSVTGSALSAPPSSTMEEIKLACICDGGFKMPAYIKSCTNLKSFSFENLHRISFRAPRDRFLREEFYIPLLTQKHSLEVLNLNYLGVAHDDEYDDDPERDAITDPEPYDRWLGSFANFTRLAKISMRAPNLLNFVMREGAAQLRSSPVDTLPKSLEFLEISYLCGFHLDAVLNGLNEMFGVRTDRFPNLKKVTICYQGPQVKVLYYQIKLIEQLESGFKEAGIEVEITNKNLPNSYSPNPFAMPAFPTEDITFHNGIASFGGMPIIDGMTGMPVMHAMPNMPNMYDDDVF
ncbi:hypothetical protein BDW59DRAFT_11591 [Aspergillus cavernicola]|uniref:Leucine-rich repeat domain-containing protein n=1 Tax=Aspergillus cavernicola TaxID=176166 RepID=A0ABR4HLB4_9EURO